MDTLDNTQWDVLLVGTGLQQSLLALALSRSGKKIVHIDENSYYGGDEAAFSLQETEEWVQKVNQGAASGAFSQASISRPDPTDSDPNTPSLSPSRAYSLALAPQIIYARSAFIQYLVSSKVFRQLEFLAVGSWWVYSSETATDEESNTGDETSRRGKLLKVPNGREDVFQDHDLDFKAKRALMKFLRFIAEYEEQSEIWEPHRSQPFPTFLSDQFKIPAALQAPLLALTLSSTSSDHTTTEYALPRIAMHLRSIGVFGPGFGAVIPKWGGLSEISQVACRSSAVGGGVYVLGKGVAAVDGPSNEPEGFPAIKLRLKDGEAVTSQWVVGESLHTQVKNTSCRSISIVSSKLTSVFPPIADEAPPPASAIIVFPSGSLPLPSQSLQGQNIPPVHIHIHSSDTGECPTGQSVIYASTSLSGEQGFQLMQQAIQALLSSVEATPSPTILWSLQYEQRSSVDSGTSSAGTNDHVLNFPPAPLDLAFDDSVLDRVKDVWQKIMGDDAGEFLVFEDREAYVDEDE